MRVISPQSPTRWGALVPLRKPDHGSDVVATGSFAFESPPQSECSFSSPHEPVGKARHSVCRSEAASVLIIVLWIAFGLVSLTLYFAGTMNFELRGADHRVAATEAAQAIAGAARYVSNILANVEEPGWIPDEFTYEPEGLPVGEATVWFIGRDPQQTRPDEPWFALVDEASKLNVNTATAAMLELLPGMTPQLAAAIVDWRDTDSEVTTNGAEDETYQRLTTAYRCKNGPFETVEELRLVYGAELTLLLGEDTNLNGALDPNESDGDLSPPDDNRDGQLDAGLFEYLTVYTREPNTAPDGTARINVGGTNRTELATLLQDNLGTDRANEILALIGGGQGAGGGGGGAGGGTTATNTFGSVLEFYIRSGMTADEFEQVEGYLTASTNTVAEGLVNVNTASEAVLACIPGIGVENAPALIAGRQSSVGSNSVGWVKDVLGEASAIQAGPYLTGRSYQFTADFAAVGRFGRGYQRVRYVFDASGEAPRITARQDLTHLGWALGREVREEFAIARQTGMPAFGNLRVGMTRSR